MNGLTLHLDLAVQQEPNGEGEEGNKGGQREEGW